MYVIRRTSLADGKEIVPSSAVLFVHSKMHSRLNSFADAFLDLAAK
jgi:hypothetical protein